MDKRYFIIAYSYVYEPKHVIVGMKRRDPVALNGLLALESDTFPGLNSVKKHVNAEGITQVVITNIMELTKEDYYQFINT